MLVESGPLPRGVIINGVLYRTKFGVLAFSSHQSYREWIIGY